MTERISRYVLAKLLETEHHGVIAGHIRAGVDPVHELGDGQGGLRKALRTSRYADATSRRIREQLQAIVDGRMTVVDE